ncbi:MAG: PKD domain-containing protein, partial [Bacteroidetes bacterium]
PLASLTFTGTNPVSGQVCWTPNCAVAGQTVRFVVAAQDVNFCQRRSFDTLTVIVRDLPPAGAGPGGTICVGESLPLQAFGGGSYQWTPAALVNTSTLANPLASPDTTTDFVVTITDTMGCPRLDTVPVLVNPLPVPLVTNDTTRCPGQPVALQASGGVSYSWAPALDLSDPNIANPLASPVVATTYTVTVTDGNGCVDSAGVTVTPMSAQAAPVAAICFGDTTSLSASGGATYQWSPAFGLSDPNSPNPIAFPGTTTAYVVTVTDTTGCVDTAQITLTVNPLPPAEAGADTDLCIGNSLTLNATGGVNYQWAPGPAMSTLNGPNPVVNPITDATYFVTVTDANGCVAGDSVRIQVNPLPVVTVSNDTAKCGQVGVPIQAGGGLTYQWLPAAGLDDPQSPTPLANPDSSLTYLVAVTDTNGCVDTGAVAVRVMYANAGPDVPVCIGDTTQLQAAGGIAYQWDPAPGLFSLGISDPQVFTLDTATYVVTVTDTTGCTDQDTVRVIVNPLPVTSTFGSDPYVCSGGGTVVTATGGVGYQWSPAAIFDDPSLASPTASPFYSGATLDTVWTFYVTVTDTNGCENIDSLDQTVRLLPIISLSNDTTKCPEDSVQLFAAGGIAYHWSPALGLSDATVPDPFANPDTTTTYTATVTAVWGCADSLEVTVNVINPQAGPDEVICAGDTVQLLASGGVSYSWNNLGSLTNGNVPDPRAFPLTTTDYEVTVTDAFGCVDRDTVQIRVNPLPPASAGPDAAICIGDTLALQASGGISYLWQGDSLSSLMVASPLAFPIATTTYTVAVTDTNGCVRLDSVVLTVNSLPLAEAGPPLTKCGEDSIQLAASGGIQYQWLPAGSLGQATSATPMAAPDSSLTYFVTVTDANGCVNTDSVRVETMYAQAAGGDTICFGDTLPLSGGYLGGLATAYAWSPALAVDDPATDSPLAFPGQTTDFVLTVTDSSGCADTDTVRVTVLPPPPAEAGPDTALCIGDTLSLLASGGIAYQWQATPSLSGSVQADPQVFPLSTTTYTVVVTDTNGCTALDTVRVQVNLLPSAEAGPDRTQCGEDSIQLAASGGVAYLWSPQAGLSDATLAEPWADPLLTTVYTVTVTDSNGCVQSDSLTVATMNADAGADVEKCPEDSRTLQAQSLGGTPVRFSWIPALGLDDTTLAAPVASPLLTTDYVVEIEDVSGCVDRDTVRVEVYASPPADAGRDTAICTGSSVALRATGGLAYSWSPATSLDDPLIASPLASPLQTTEYVLTVVDTNACTALDTVSVQVNPLPRVEAGPDQAICRGEAALLFAAGAATYVWQPTALLSDPLSADPLAFPLTDATFSVVGTDTNGCANVDSLRITVWQPPVAMADSFYEICLGQETFLQAEGGVSYRWSTGETRDRIRVAPFNTTDYWVIPFGPQGCAGDTLPVRVRVERDLPEADFAPDPVEGFYPLPVTFSNRSRFATRYLWDFGDGNVSEETSPVHTYQDPGDYVVTLTVDNEIGCPAQKAFSFVRALNFTMFFPNAFSPNGDGHNDAFEVVMRSIEFFQIRIYDRWGREVFAANEPNFRWDGTKNGRAVPEGVYVFEAEGFTFKGERIKRGGTVTLIR